MYRWKTPLAEKSNSRARMYKIVVVALAILNCGPVTAFFSIINYNTTV